MGTHPIFESDFDCLTEHVRVEEKRQDRESSNPAAYRREKQINRNRRKREKNMVLTPRQRDELKTAVASFLKEIGADEARKVFIQESDVKNVSFIFFLKFFKLKPTFVCIQVDDKKY